jgi:hypothetical protein
MLTGVVIDNRDVGDGSASLKAYQAVCVLVLDHHQ